jgi:hypothetical protein
MSRLVGIESLERRDVVGEWMVGLAGAGSSAASPNKKTWFRFQISAG